MTDLRDKVVDQADYIRLLGEKVEELDSAVDLLRDEVDQLHDAYVRAYHASYAFMHPGASETVRRADANDFMRRVRALRRRLRVSEVRGEGEK